MFTYLLYAMAAAGLAFSWSKDKKKTRQSLKKAWKAFENILPQFLSIIIFIGLVLSTVSTDTISALIGAESGMLGVALASAIGSVALIPGFVAFPLAASLLENGAGYMQVAALVSTLMTVGLVAVPLEMEIYGKKLTIVRNVSSFILSIVIALVVGGILG